MYTLKKKEKEKYLLHAGKQLFLQEGREAKKGKKQPHSAEEVRPKFLGKLLYTKLGFLSQTHYLTKPLVFELLSRELDNKTPLVMENFKLISKVFLNHKINLS